MAEIPAFLLRHTVQVETLLGSGPYGDSYAAPVTVKCFRDDKRQIVRGANGDEVVSEVTLYARLAATATFQPDSRVTWDGRTAYVVSLARRDDAGMGAWQHIEVNL